MCMQEKKTETQEPESSHGKQISNSKTADSGGKLIFGNPVLCSQLINDFVDMKELKGVRPEDIEDVTERFIPMFTEERDADVIKRVHLPGKSDIFIALIEHKSAVDYNVVMQMFHYMSYIWEEYERIKEGEQKGITKTKGFRYPPILPIVYYEDTAEWTSPMHLKDRIFLSDVFGEYLPDYRYLLFGLREHGKAELISRRDYISFTLLINGLRNYAEFRNLDLPKDYLDNIGKAPGDVLIVYKKLISTFLRELNVPEEEIVDLTEQIEGGNMNRLFENFERIDIQAIRKQYKEEGLEEGREEGRKVGLKEGRKVGLKEGRDVGLKEGREIRLVTQTCNCLKKGLPVDQIADLLCTEEYDIKAIVDAAEEFAPDYDIDKIVKKLIPAQAEA